MRLWEPGCSSAWQSLSVSRTALLISRQSGAVPSNPFLLDTPILGWGTISQCCWITSARALAPHPRHPFS